MTAVDAFAYMGRAGNEYAVPAVCICAHPLPDSIGECQRCKRPYKPEVPGFDACREWWAAAWRNALLKAAG